LEPPDPSRARFHEPLHIYGICIASFLGQQQKRLTEYRASVGSRGLTLSRAPDDIFNRHDRSSSLDTRLATAGGAVDLGHLVDEEERWHLRGREQPHHVEIEGAVSFSGAN